MVCVNRKVDSEVRKDEGKIWDSSVVAKAEEREASDAGSGPKFASEMNSVLLGVIQSPRTRCVEVDPYTDRKSRK